MNQKEVFKDEFIFQDELCFMSRNIFKSFIACLEAGQHFRTVLWNKVNCWGKTDSKSLTDAHFLYDKAPMTASVLGKD